MEEETTAAVEVGQAAAAEMAALAAMEESTVAQEKEAMVKETKLGALAEVGKGVVALEEEAMGAEVQGAQEGVAKSVVLEA